MAGLLQTMKDLYFGPPPAKGLMQDLEYASRTKGGLTRDEDTTLQVANYSTTALFVLFGGLGSSVGWFALGLGQKLLGLPYTPVFARFCSATERMKEIEATNSDDEARSVSRETAADNRPFGDLMEDSLACILGSPEGDEESNNRP